MNKSEVILEVGAEGGAITLYGVRDLDGWRYSTSVLDQTPSLLPDEFDEPEIRKDSEVVNSWEAALRLIDRYPWHSLPTHSSTRSFANGYGLPYKAGSAEIEDQRRIASLNVGASCARHACCDVR